MAGGGVLAARRPPTAPDGTAPATTDPGWLRLRRRWAPGDTLTVALDLAARLTRPDPRVDAVRGCVAIERGPLVHCLEGVDHPASPSASSPFPTAPV
ncbi:beta-L-arabinofuranosidase domain-containing protein [Streptomyces curacoi]|uniref:Non-reducing end beta-L-arabinofuranosidase-like GH127 C-terminal domain-containing protein n=1 Tax=Streptomyces curacoi TaxID=146536 RepID=A0A117PAR1_9ACTN|nr:hypothetical protein AQI70_15885 [Streptomyces curacoi]